MRFCARFSLLSPCRARGAVFVRGLVVSAVLGLAAGCGATGSAEDSRLGAGAAEGGHLVALAARGKPYEETEDLRQATEDELEEIKWLISILENVSNDRTTRSGAAVRLLNMGLEEAVTPLVGAVESDEPELVMAVVAAISEARSPAGELLPALVRSLTTAPDPVRDAIALALGRFGDAALESLGKLAAEGGRPAQERLGPIYALGSFRSRDAAVHLMSLLEADRNEHPAVVEAVCSALRRSTGLPYGNDPEAWRRWWLDARDQPQEQWLTNLVQRLDEQLTEAEQQIQRERERRAALERRIAEAYGELLPITLNVEEQLRFLPRLLEDRLPSLRIFAIDRVARLLRDSVKIPDELQLQLSVMLGDEVPAIRRQAAQLIDQLNVESAGKRIATRLAHETEREVAAAFLDILVKRHTPAALDAISPWLIDAELAARAAEVAWEVVATLPLDQQQIDSLRTAVLEADVWLTLPEHVRLISAIGNDEETRLVEQLLDEDDPALRHAVAEGFQHRDLRRPLLDRAHDEVIYPFAVRSLLKDPVDMSSFLNALALAPATEAGRAVWSDTVLKLAAKLPPDQIIEIDDMLAAQLAGGPGTQSITPQLRAGVLGRARTLPAEAVSAAVRVELLTRLAQQLLLLNQPQQAHEAMEGTNGRQLSDEAARVKFEAAARAGHYALAAQLQPLPEPWIALLALLADRDVVAAITLRDEIGRRFGDQLHGELRENFDRLSERLAREGTSAGTGSSA